jgi:hypothetical protein
MADTKKQGVTTDDKGTFIPENMRAPYDPKNLHRSKADFVEAQKIRREKEQKIKAYAAELDNELKEKKAKLDTDVEPDKAPEGEPAKKHPGRPKKID